MSASPDGRPAVRRLRRLAASAMLPLVILGASGCDHRIPDAVHPDFTDPERYHRITVAPERAETVIPAHDGPLGKADDALATAKVARKFLREGRGPLTIVTTSRAGSRIAQIQSVLDREGVPPNRVRVVQRAGAARPGTVLLSYDRIAAIPPACGDWSEDVTYNPEQLPYPNWGCATQRSLASMVANPADLDFPARETPRGSDRRAIPRKAFTDTPPGEAKAAVKQ